MMPSDDRSPTGVPGRTRSGQSASWRTDNVGRVLFTAADLFVREKLQIVHRGGFGSVTEVQMALFHHLDLQGTRLTTLAARAAMTKQGMSEIVGKAEAVGLVARQPDLGDGRAKIVAFTPTGLRMLDALRCGVVEAERQMAAAAGARFLTEMKTRLGTYSAALDPAAVSAIAVRRSDAAWRRDNVGCVLVLASSLFVRDMLSLAKLGELAHGTQLQLPLLRNLDLGGTRLTTIAARAMMTKPGMMDLVDKAEAAGFVARRPDPLDGRAKIVAFTSAGLRLLDRLRVGIVAAEARMGATAGDAFVQDMKTRLTRYAAQAKTPRPAGVDRQASDTPATGRPKRPSLAA